MDQLKLNEYCKIIALWMHIFLRGKLNECRYVICIILVAKKNNISVHNLRIFVTQGYPTIIIMTMLRDAIGDIFKSSKWSQKK